MDAIAEHLTALPEEPVFRPFPPEPASTCLDSKPPEAGQEADDILDTFLRGIGLKSPMSFVNHEQEFLERWRSVLSDRQLRTLRDIGACRTAALGARAMVVSGNATPGSGDIQVT